MLGNTNSIWGDDVMEWSRRVELSYRVYVRQHMDINLRFQEIGSALVNSIYVQHGLINFVEQEDSYWPIPPEKESEVDAKGYLITELDGRKCIVVRELLITVSAPTNKDVCEAVDFFIKQFGSDMFASIRIIEENLSEFQAV